MPATRSGQKKTAGKASAPKATSKAASSTATRSRAKQQATKPSTSFDTKTASSPAKTRSRTSKAPAVPPQPTSSSDPPAPSAPKTRGGRKNTTTLTALIQSAPSAVKAAATPAKTLTRKRKASKALDQDAPSPPPKAKTARRVASKAPRKDSATAPTLDDAPKEEKDTEKPEPLSHGEPRKEQQESDSSLTSLESADFDEETRNAVECQKPEAKTAPTSKETQDLNTSTAATTAATQDTDASTSATIAKIQDLNAPTAAITATSVPKPVDATTTTAPGQKPEAKTAPILTANPEPTPSTTAANAAKLPDPSATLKTNKRAESTAQGKKSKSKPATTSKGTAKPASKKKSAAANAPEPPTVPRNDSSAMDLDNPMTITAANTSDSGPALTVTGDATTAPAQGSESSSKDKATTPIPEKTASATAHSQPTPGAKAEDDARKAPEDFQAEDSAALSNSQCSLPASAHEEATTGTSDPGASNATTDRLPGDSPQSKNVPAFSDTSSASAPMSVSPLSAAVEPPVPATPNAITETGLIEKETDAPATRSSDVPESLLLTGQSFKVLWPVYQQVREIIELKESQGKEVIDAERKLMWQLYEQCRLLKTQLEDHEARKGEK